MRWGVDADGKRSRLKDLWPSDEEIDAVVKRQRQTRAVPRRLRSRCSRTLGEADAKACRRCTTGGRRAPIPPPAVLGRRAGRRTHAARACARWRCWATTSPPTTCRRPTPSCQQRRRRIPGEDGPAGRDFNSYATHRGDHLTAQRATFANPQIGQRDGGGRRQVKKARWRARRAGRQGDAHVGSDRNLHGAQAAADHHRRRRLRPGQLARLGGQGRAPGRAWRRSSPRASSASTAPTWSAWACCRWSSSRAPPARRWASTAPRPTTWSANTAGHADAGGHRKRRDPAVPVTCRLDTDEDVAIYEAGGVLQHPCSKQTDGMGGATSSTNRVVIICRRRCRATTSTTSMARCRSTATSSTGAANCGNPSSAVGPFAIANGSSTHAAHPARWPLHGAGSGRPTSARLIVAHVPVRWRGAGESR